VLIEKGLKRGEEVVTQGHFRLDQNAKVEVTREPKAATTRTSAAD
jgi:hypothetical protein